MNENNKDKASLVVSKILRETQEGSIKWSIFYNNKSDIQSDDDTFVIGNVYVTHIDTKDFRIYRFKLKIETSPFYTTNKEELKWRHCYRLELYNSTTGRSEWIFPNTNAIYDLYEVVCTQVSGINDFLSKYLNEDKREAD